MEKIMYNGEILAYVIRDEYDEPGINFMTPGDLSLQMAHMQHPKGHVIVPHKHVDSKRVIYDTKEVLIMKEGKMRVDFYDEDRKIIDNTVVKGGDIILLVNLSHGFEILEETKMVEIKQGPFIDGKDKIKFS